MTAKRHDIHERLVFVTRFIQSLKSVKILRVFKLGIQRGFDAADHRYQMRHKGNTNTFACGGRQALADLWQMPMPGSPVGLETLAYFTVEHANLALPASTAGAGLGIGYQPCRIDQTVFQQRQESQLYSCRITPWIRNQL